MAKRKRKAAKKRPGQNRQPKRRHNGPGRRSPPSIMRRLEQWPFHEVLINSDWREFGALTQLVVSRRHEKSGDVVVGVFLVDLGCLGIKNGFLSLLSSQEYRQLLGNILPLQRRADCDPDLAAKIILTGLEYAESLGFQPHPDAVEAFPVLIGADASACDELVPVGDGQGRPYFISGPHDNVKRVLRTLEAAVGPDGFDFIVGGPDATALFGDSVEDLDELE